MATSAPWPTALRGFHGVRLRLSIHDTASARGARRQLWLGARHPTKPTRSADGDRHWPRAPIHGPVTLVHRGKARLALSNHCSGFSIAFQIRDAAIQLHRSNSWPTFRHLGLTTDGSTHGCAGRPGEVYPNPAIRLRAHATALSHFSSFTKRMNHHPYALALGHR